MTTRAYRRTGDRLAYCPTCRGVLPFEEVALREPLGMLPRVFGGAGRAGFVCSRCGVLYRLADPAAANRRVSRRFFLYAAVAAAVPLLAAAGAAALGPASPFLGRWPALALGALPALALLCLARGFQLRGRADRYERLEVYELDELARGLCPGMLRSDVEAELFRRGWRMGKIRTLLEGLRPLTAARG